MKCNYHANIKACQLIQNNNREIISFRDELSILQSKAGAQLRGAHTLDGNSFECAVPSRILSGDDFDRAVSTSINQTIPIGIHQNDISSELQEILHVLQRFVAHEQVQLRDDVFGAEQLHKVLLAVKERQINKGSVFILDLIRNEHSALDELEKGDVMDQLVLAQSQLKLMDKELQTSQTKMLSEYSTLWKYVDDMNKIDANKNEEIKRLLEMKNNIAIERDQVQEKYKKLKIAHKQLLQELEVCKCPTCFKLFKLS